MCLTADSGQYGMLHTDYNDKAAVMINSNISSAAVQQDEKQEQQYQFWRGSERFHCVHNKDKSFLWQKVLGQRQTLTAWMASTTSRSCWPGLLAKVLCSKAAVWQQLLTAWKKATAEVEGQE